MSAPRAFLIVRLAFPALPNERIGKAKRPVSAGFGGCVMHPLRKEAKLSVSGMTTPHSHESLSHFGHECQLEPKKEGFRCFDLTHGYGSHGHAPWL